MAERKGADLRLLLASAERLSEAAIARAESLQKTPCSRSSASLVRMTRADHRDPRTRFADFARAPPLRDLALEILALRGMIDSIAACCKCSTWEGAALPGHPAEPSARQLCRIAVDAECSGAQQLGLAITATQQPYAEDARAPGRELIPHRIADHIAFGWRMAQPLQAGEKQVRLRLGARYVAALDHDDV